jgi:hypothetical protein
VEEEKEKVRVAGLGAGRAGGRAHRVALASFGVAFPRRVMQEGRERKRGPAGRGRAMDVMPIDAVWAGVVVASGLTACPPRPTHPRCHGIFG